jgi:hypothetical protein
MGEIHMRTKFIHSAVFAIAVTASVFATTAKAGDFAKLAKLCAANPNCRQEQPVSTANGTAYFFIRKANSVVSVRCEENKGCKRVFPRGSSGPITDIEALFGGL